MSLEQNRQERENESHIELDAIRAEASLMTQRFAALMNRPEVKNKEPGSTENASEVLCECILVRLDCLQQSVVLNQRLCAFEAANRRSSWQNLQR
jgi:hypothetical protein